MSATGDSRLRLLVLARREPWPLNSGGTLRLYHLLANLPADFSVTLAVVEPLRWRGELPKAWRVLSIGRERDRGNDDTCSPERRSRGGLMARLARRHYGCDAHVRAWMNRWAQPENFDVALLSGAVNGLYGEDLRIPAVWDPADDLVLYTVRKARTEGGREWLGLVRRAPFYAAYERYVARRCAATVFCSPVDAAWARRGARAPRTEVVVTGVDADFFAPVEGAPEPKMVLFFGSLNFPPNVDGIVWFAQRVWPSIHARDAQRRLVIVGKQPVAAVCALGRGAGVEVIGEVPDVRPYIARAAAVVVPTRAGGGVKNKLLQACAMGRPVVASPRALAGLSARPGYDVLCAANEDDWQRQVARLLEQPRYGEALGRAGGAWVRRAHAWDAAALRLAGLLRAAARPGVRERAHPAAADLRGGERQAFGCAVFAQGTDPEEARRPVACR